MDWDTERAIHPHNCFEVALGSLNHEYMKAIGLGSARGSLLRTLAYSMTTRSMTVESVPVLF